MVPAGTIRKSNTLYPPQNRRQRGQSGPLGGFPGRATTTSQPENPAESVQSHPIEWHAVLCAIGRHERRPRGPHRPGHRRPARGYPQAAVSPGHGSRPAQRVARVRSASAVRGVPVRAGHQRVSAAAVVRVRPLGHAVDDRRRRDTAHQQHQHLQHQLVPDQLLRSRRR